ncbi:hypothetical protein BJV74DRAFT_830146 [Russula compacta]|nr:hypothetical protein BJV74DRAFT_830146 [Russula compacta]
MSEPEPNRPQNTATTAFGPPFDDADADIILRSSDQVEFMVYKVILSKASPFFKTMFSLPQPRPTTDTPQDPRPIIDLAENSRILAALLLAIYPLTSATADPLPLGDLIVALETVRKYDMASASEHFLRIFKESASTWGSPLEVFYAAYSHKLEEASRIAAKASLKHRLSLDDIGERLPNTNGPALYELWKFHRACSAAAVSTISSHHQFTWLTPAQTWWGSSRPICNCDKDQRGPRLMAGSTYQSAWQANTSWSGYIERARNALGERPCSEAVTDHEMLRLTYEGKMCEACRKCICGLSDFSRYLGEEVERRVSRVPLDLHF